ncbi:preprotein translocase subunit YajC [Nocardioides sp. GY 10113]|uniref:preprotein translocase subunit YajC n=1 Tax=Nocardioides sp. GY 10113 TaxID=2569761 RepID=UPI0010A8927C|nr:preprotein translocase subunit YajC [Nocardioides sp. GY 10113]TIC82495.1 preprotein translocase subunit YajC [Nocardioides sp. GY 10113]
MELIPILAIAVIFWLLLIRPQQRRQKAVQQLQAALQVGDEVMLTSGILGTIAEITDEHLLIEVSPGTTVRVVRGAIGSKVQRNDEPATDERGDEYDGYEPDSDTGREQGEN